MKSKINDFKLLSIWEKRWGKLNDKWSQEFLKDKRINQILVFPPLLIFSAVQNHKKLEEILTYLNKSTHKIKSENKNKEIPPVNLKKRKKKDLGTTLEKESIYEWILRMEVAKFDPESTFPRLQIKSDRETCAEKKKYEKEKDAILALIQLGQRKGELIKQIPYRCNICRNYHNSHLISRQIIQKLKREYKPISRSK
jgi:hypothetical protein